MFSNIKLPHCGDRNLITPPTIHTGMAKLATDYAVDPGNIPWTAYTIAPPDGCQEGDYLESMHDAFEYYREHGVDKVSVQYKSMGSRAVIYYDYDTNRLVIYSRSGFKFRALTDEMLYAIKMDARGICEKEDLHGFVFDAELTPWNLVAESLIARNFIEPGLCYVQSTGDTERYNKFFDILYSYMGDPTVPNFNVFNIIAIKKMGLWINFIEGTLHTKHMWYIGEYTRDSKFFSELPYWETINLNDIYDCEVVIAEWERFTTEESAEGFVVKPDEIASVNESDFYHLPAMKVRGQDYLRIIYGINYDEYLDMLRKRPTNRKRFQSVSEFSMSMMVLDAWCRVQNGQESPEKHLNLVYGYFGLIENGTLLDATL